MISLYLISTGLEGRLRLSLRVTTPQSRSGLSSPRDAVRTSRVVLNTIFHTSTAVRAHSFTTTPTPCKPHKASVNTVTVLEL